MYKYESIPKYEAQGIKLLHTINIIIPLMKLP